MPPDEHADRPLDPRKLEITASGTHEYDVTITHPSGADTRHCVSVPESLLDDLGVTPAQEPSLVRASLVYLMEREPSALPEEFDLDEIGRAIPAYRDDIVSRL
ncbi:MAG: hypothetical protein QOE01_2320 [Actinomycetota bacterium]|nr:hypothetical protein [Actinomycetota bacterium]